MKHNHHNHHDDNLRAAVKQAHLKSPPRPASTEDFDASPSEAEALQPAGYREGAAMLSNQQRLELNQVSERNKRFLNPLQSVWPTPSA